MPFEDLQLIEPLLRAVHAEGYTEPSPIQTQSIPHILAGRDLLGCAQTGTGKTAAFALPILQRLYTQGRPAVTPMPPSRGQQRSTGATVTPIRVLVLSPTRELASQIGESFDVYGRYTGQRQITVFGGVKINAQIARLQRGADILVATPGRLLDLMGQSFVKLDKLEVLVLDEADRMLDMGFIRDVRRIIDALPRRRQTLLFSATMPDDILDLAHSILNNPISVAVTPVASTVETIQQSVYFVEKLDKALLLENLLRDQAISRVLVFTRTKHGADKLVRFLERGPIRVEAIHGNKAQNARERALANFKDGTTRVLIATDIAARGIDVDNITHVVNYDLPNVPESYVHRIGRTGRAGAGGIAFSFCDEEERAFLIDIERLIKLHIPVANNYPYASPLPPPSPTDLSPRRGGRPAQQNGSQQNRSPNTHANASRNGNAPSTAALNASKPKNRRNRQDNASAAAARVAERVTERSR